jgi:hypothetical protein
MLFSSTRLHHPHTIVLSHLDYPRSTSLPWPVSLYMIAPLQTFRKVPDLRSHIVPVGSTQLQPVGLARSSKEVLREVGSSSSVTKSAVSICLLHDMHAGWSPTLRPFVGGRAFSKDYAAYACRSFLLQAASHEKKSSRICLDVELD